MKWFHAREQALKKFLEMTMNNTRYADPPVALPIEFIYDDQVTSAFFDCDLTNYENLAFWSRFWEHDRKKMLQIVKKHGHQLQYASNELKQDLEIAFSASLSSYIVVSSLPKEVNHNKEFLLKLIEQNPNCYYYIPEELKKDHDISRMAISKDPSMLRIASEWCDREMVKQAIERDGMALRGMPYSYRNDRELGCIAVKNNPKALLLLSTELQNDRELVKMAVQQNGEILWSLIETTYKLDKEIALLALNNTKSAWNLDESLLNDKDIAMHYLKLGHWFMRIKSPSLRKDKDIILQAVKYSSPKVYLELDNDMKRDHEICMQVVKDLGCLLSEMPYEIQNDFEIVFQAVTTNPFALKYASKELRANRNVVLQAFSKALRCCQPDYLPKQAISLEEYVENAQQQRLYQNCVFGYISEELKHDLEIILKALEFQDETAALIPHEALIHNDYEVVKTALQKNGAVLEHLPLFIRNDKEFVLLAVRQCGSAMRYASQELKNDMELLNAVVKSSPLLSTNNFSELLLQSSLTRMRKSEAKQRQSIVPTFNFYASIETKQDLELVKDAICNMEC
ncbi:hypothetical protein C9374_005553 [Naegleria lovaniensis]|uniref:DUF4116 domain-containing protein n=1 Tax=Naegleria lovaniensis TaxID=51637 RepID=A0AA88GJY3_NAELO|nr:uncharacterized protein C9374_005553 [Naegleria lovaniensis]KAG2382351.1 hypothetical protein C9374_005553 [Naegleria lovaniensis]